MKISYGVLPMAYKIQVLRDKNCKLITSVNVFACKTSDKDTIPALDGTCIQAIQLYNGVYKFDGLSDGYYYIFVDGIVVYPYFIAKDIYSTSWVNVSVSATEDPKTINYSDMTTTDGSNLPYQLIKAKTDVDVSIAAQLSGRGAYISDYDANSVTLKLESFGDDVDSELLLEIKIKV